MIRSMIAVFFMVILTIGASAADHQVGGGDSFPKEVKVGEVITFDRPAVGGRNKVDVTVNGQPVTGELERSQSTNGRTLIGGGKHKFKVKAEKAGDIEINITITPAGGQSVTKKHIISVKD
ncbi:hypothetical protein [Zavarzinella formosa]|uniref:hypothetical protein n=1 Tax=Zavarzinella formosa TaxID=360055 RepID=UPI0002F9A91D|nr:hypothetical protein [Zavarzinella formosa]